MSVCSLSVCLSVTSMYCDEMTTDTKTIYSLIVRATPLVCLIKFSSTNTNPFILKFNSEISTPTQIGLMFFCGIVALLLGAVTCKQGLYGLITVAASHCDKTTKDDKMIYP